MYYQHLAVKVLIKDDLDSAYSLLAAAMQLSPDNIETLNTLAFLHKRNDKPAVAESIYEYLLEHTKGSVSALSNYVIFLKESNRKQDAALYEDKYLEIEDDNLFTSEIFGQAKDYFQLGNKAEANKAMQKSSGLAYPKLDEKLYSAKFDMLQRHH